MKIAIILIISIALFLLMLIAINKRVKKRGNIVKRMKYFASINRAARAALENNTQKNAKKNLYGYLLAAIKKISDKVNINDNIKFVSKCDLLMQQAGWPLLGSEYIICMVIVMLIGALVMLLLTLKLSGAITGAFLSLVVCWILLKFSINKRREAFSNQLGDSLIMISNALRAGFSFLQAFELVSREMNDPIKGEVEKVLRDVNVGLSLETTLDSMGKRVNSQEFDLVVTAVLIQRQVGGNLAQILDSISNTISERVRMKREVHALTAQGRMSGIVLGCLPIGVALALYSVNNNYFDLLLSEPIGKIAIAGALFMEFVGFLVINRMVDIEV